MAENEDGQEKSEEATPERREEFREKGQIAVSKELTSVFILTAVIGLFGIYVYEIFRKLKHILISHFQSLDTSSVTEDGILPYVGNLSIELIKMIAPVFLALMVSAVFITFAQTKMSWSWKKLAPDFKRLDPISGLGKMVSAESAVELLKSIGKMLVVSVVAFLILKSDMLMFPSYIQMSMIQVWSHWGDLTWELVWYVVGMLLFITAGDMLYTFISFENKLKMTKQEVKEEYKKRESDPHVKAKIKRMQREIAMAKTITATKEATVVITNPTHFAVALRYELGMSAPIVVAKGEDFLALRMKEVAKESNVPIIENKPLARTLFRICKVGQEIPESLYKAVSEVIRYVFMLKGKRLTRGS
jgi:flagellar biosynthetic protein FlhB